MRLRGAYQSALSSRVLVLAGKEAIALLSHSIAILKRHFLMHAIAPIQNPTAQQEANRIRTNKRLVRELVCLLAVVYFALGVFEVRAHYRNAHLLGAISRNDHAETKQLLQEGADPNAQEEDNEIDHYGVRLYVRLNRPKDSALDLALNGTPSYPIVRVLFDAGARVGPNSTTPKPLFSATPDSEETLQLLLTHGAIVNDRDDGGATPLHYAVRNGSLLSVRLLLAHGANINARDRDGTSPLLDSIRYTHLSSNITQLLLASGANVDADSKGDTPLLEAVDQRNLSLARLLLAYKARANVKSNYENPLLRAVSVGDISMTKLLLTHGADPQARNHEGKTVLESLQHSTRNPQQVRALQKLLIAAGAKQ